MIDPFWISKLACPTCYGPPEADGTADKRALENRGEGLYCPTCMTRYRFGPNRDFVNLLPNESAGRATHYADEEFQERLGVREGPLVLSAGVKARMASRMLDVRTGDALIDFGCGAGKFASHFAAQGAQVCGVDMAPFFLKSAISNVSLVAADLRRLPLQKGAATKGYTLDVLEHVDEIGVKEILTEARRVLGPNGKLFVYTHAMESSTIAGFQRGVNRVAKALGRLGHLDSDKEAMRKADHVNAIRSHEHFDELARAAGFVVTKRVYYNVVAKAVIEDLALKLVQHRQAQAKPGSTSATAAPAKTPSHIVGRPAPGAAAVAVARGLTSLLMLDVQLFGSVRTGPFFGLLKAR